MCTAGMDQQFDKIDSHLRGQQQTVDISCGTVRVKGAGSAVCAGQLHDGHTFRADGAQATDAAELVTQPNKKRPWR